MHVRRRACLCVFCCSVESSSLLYHVMQPAGLLGPWDFAGKNTGIGYRFLLQGIFLTLGWNPRHLHLMH